MSEETPEEERARKLEEARKKVEELKKKKNKKKNKSKKKEVTAEAGEEVVETAESSDDKEGMTGVVSKTEEDLVPVVSSTQAEGSEKEECTNEDEGSMKERKEPKEVIEEVKVEPNSIDITITDQESGSMEQVEEADDTHEQENETRDKDASTNSLFANEQELPHFMNTIQQKKNEQALELVQQEVQTLKAQIKTLKFVNMEHETVIEELEEEVTSLKGQLSLKIEEIKQVRSQLNEQDKELKLLREKSAPLPNQMQNPSTSEKQSSTAPVVSSDHANLQKWKNWNMDMSNWRSIGIGPVVQL